MITSSKVAFGITLGGIAAAIGAIATTKEPEGLFQLHAAIVLGVGGGMLKIGWEIVKTNRKIGATLDRLATARADDRKSNDDERDAAVGIVKSTVEQSRDDILGALGRLRQDIQKGKGGK